MLAAFTGDIGLAEELAQDALVDALRQWPAEGTPRRPGAWLTAVGKRKAVDRFRRDRTLAAKYAQLGRVATEDPVDDDIPDQEIDDDRLRLIFVACHPVLSVPARVALTLRLVGGLSVPEIARAYVVPEATIAQRIVRAKRSIAKAGIPFEVPAEVETGGAPRWRARGRLPRLQRGLLGHGRRGLAPARALRRGAPSRPRPRRARPRRARGARTGGPHGTPVLAATRPHRTLRRARAAPRPGPPHLGPPPHRAGRGLPGPGRRAEPDPRALHAPGRHRRLPCPGLQRRTRRTGTRWSRSTPRSPASCRRPSSSSTAPWPCPWPRDRPMRSRSSTSSWPRARLEHYHLLSSVRGDLLDRLGRHAEAADEFTRRGVGGHATSASVPSSPNAPVPVGRTRTPRTAASRGARSAATSDRAD